MKQVSNVDYEVTDGETIILRVKATGTTNNVLVSYDGKAPNVVSDVPRLYSFTVKGKAGDVFALDFQGTYDAGAPDFAEFDLYLQGSKGGGELTGPVGLDVGSTVEIDIDFKVV